MSYDLINYQIQEAKNCYPSQITQTSQYEFQVAFDRTPLNTFIVTLEINYPNRPPRVRRCNKEFPTSMTTNWMPIFTLLYLVQHLQVCSNVQKVDFFNLNREEIKNMIYSSRPEAISTASARSSLLFSNLMPTTCEAKKQTIQANRLLIEDQRKVDSLICDVSDKAGILRNALTSLSQQQMANGQRQGRRDEEKAAAMKQYKDEAKKLQRQIQKMNNNLASGRISFEEFKEKFTPLCEKMEKYNLTAQLMEDRLDL